MTTAFFAPGIPKGQPRPRAFSRGGHARVYDPGTAEGWKSSIAVAAQGHRGAFPAGPIAVSIRFVFPRPKSHTRKDGTLKGGVPEFHISKPDADNAAKAVLDALTQVGVWSDDAQVAQLWVSKRYGEHPGAAVTIDSLAGDGSL